LKLSYLSLELGVDKNGPKLTALGLGFIEPNFLFYPSGFIDNLGPR
jgi:hypothetical protein